MLCSWTSWWEIIYLLLSAASIDAMLVSGTYSSCGERNRKVLRYYAILNFALYSVLVISGVFFLNKFLISFELLLIFTAPTILVLFFLNGWRYFRYRENKDLALLITWIWLGVTIGAYFIYLTLGFTDALWARGIRFSENDVLHIGLIGWMIYIAVYVANRVTDLPQDDLISSEKDRD
jgi:amino acid transporter